MEITEGMTYLIYEDQPSQVYKLLNECLDKGTPGLCLTSTFPGKLKKTHNVLKAQMIWISEMNAKDAINPQRLDFEIARGINRFLQDNEKGIMLLDCFSFLVLVNGFDKVRKFLKKLNDSVALAEATFILSLNPEAFTKESVMTLARDFDQIEDMRAKPEVLQAASIGIKCPSCGTINNPQSPACIVCGNSLIAEATPKVEKEPSKPDIPAAVAAPEPTRTGPPPPSAPSTPSRAPIEDDRRRTSKGGRGATENWYQKAIELDRMGRAEEAIEAYNEALKINPHDVRSLFNKGVDLQMMGQAEEAVRCYDDALEITPEDGELWSNKGIALRMLGRTEEAIRCYDKALQINPNDGSAWSNKGVALRSLGRTEEAIKCYNKALEINPNDAGVWSNKGVALHRLGRLKDAVECYDRALALDPNRRVAKRNREVALKDLS